MQRCIFTSAVQKHHHTFVQKKIKIKSFYTTLSTEQKDWFLWTIKILFSTKKESVENVPYTARV